MDLFKQSYCSREGDLTTVLGPVLSADYLSQGVAYIHAGHQILKFTIASYVPQLQAMSLSKKDCALHVSGSGQGIY